MAETWIAPFSEFSMGGEDIHNTQIRVFDTPMGANHDLTLGADFFLAHRIYVSGAQKRLFFTYNGGPVFRLEPNRRAVQTAAEAPPSGATPAAPPEAAGQYSDTPTDAAGFVRRADASMARRDFRAAIGDFGKAIELEPDKAQHYVQRANAHAAAGEAVLAMADFDQALKMRPGDVAALVGRGRLYLISHDVARGQADLDAAVKADPDAALAVGTIYANNQRFEPAVADMDLWIGRHPESGDLAAALSERCRTRAYWNHDLDKALADCEAAIKHGPRTAGMFEARGLVHLRRGEAAAALDDFNRALKDQPKLPWALYGRALVEREEGQAQAAQTDLAAATAIAPRIEEAVRRYHFDGPASGERPGA